jgi:DNA repair protein RadC
MIREGTHRNVIGDRAGPEPDAVQHNLPGACANYRSSRSKKPRHAHEHENYAVKVVTFRLRRKPEEPDRRVIDTPAAAAALAGAIIPDDAKEHFSILMLDTKNQIVAVHEVSVGSLSACPVHPRDVFGPALRVMGVAALILLHNHPSGDPTPSREDIRLTRQLVEAANLLDLRIHDHIVIGNGNDRFISMHEAALM